MKVKEIISTINNTTFFSINAAIKAAGLTSNDCVNDNFQGCTHKNFDMVTAIYKADDGYVAITGITNDKAKRGYDYYGIETFAEEYEAIPMVKYVPKYRR